MISNKLDCIRNKTNCLFIGFVLSVAIYSCGDSPKTPTAANTNSNTIKVIKNERNDFIADSAYKNIEKQLSFGYRIPGTKEHKKCSEWLFQSLSNSGDTAYLQSNSTQKFDGTTIPVYNIVGSFNP